MPTAPLVYHGTISDFVGRYLDPMLPEAAVVEAFHKALVAYVRRSDAVHLVRGVTGTPRRSTLRTAAGLALRPTDNSPAWWWHALLFAGTEVTESDMGGLVSRTPAHVHDMDRRRTLNQARWHAAHILNAKDRDTAWWTWSRATVVRRFVRSIHPCNVFYVPLTDWPRVGADPRLIAAAAAHLRRRYASVWDDFSTLAHAPAGHGLADVDGPLVIGPPVGSGLVVVPSSASATRSRRRSVGDGAIPQGVWGEVLAGGHVPPVGALLATHPQAACLRERLLDGLTVERLVAIADALHNRCRPSAMSAAAPGQPMRQAHLAWDALMLGACRTDRRPSGWTGTIRLLVPGSDEGLREVAALGIGEVARVCARIVAGPYRRACEAGIR
jgi:hypothetical protein